MKPLPPAFEYALTDHTRALMRWVREGDAVRFLKGFEQLSDTSKFSRFFDHLKQLSPSQLAYFTQIDYSNHMAWGALDLDRPSRPGLGVGRYIRLSREPDVADFAVTIADSAQGTGLGTALMAALHLSAAEAGIQQFSCDVLEDNTAFIARLERLGGTILSSDYGAVSMRLPVYASGSALTQDNDSARVFAAALDTIANAPLFRGVMPRIGV